MQLLQLTKIARGLELLQACKCSGKGREPTPTKAMAKDIHGAQAEFTLLTTQTHSSRRQTLQHYKRITPTLCSSAANNSHVVQVHNTYDKVLGTEDVCHAVLEVRGSRTDTHGHTQVSKVTVFSGEG